MSKYYIHKQLIPSSKNSNDKYWHMRQIWVLKLNSEDVIDEFDKLDDAISKRDELELNDPTERVYKVVTKNENGTFSDVS